MKRNNNEELGMYGEYGGSFIPEDLKAVLGDIAEAFYDAVGDEKFIEELSYYLTNYVGRETPLFYAKNLTEAAGGAKIYLKREDLAHTGAHKINNTLGQCLLARRMGLKRIIAETGAGQHGVATATAAALLGLDCTVYMGKIDAEKQPLNVQRMELLGAKVEVVEEGYQNLKAAVDVALLDLVKNRENTFYVIGSAVGPYPYPGMVKYFQSVIGEEIKEQLHKQEKKLPDYVVACVGGGSNAIGAFSAFIGNKKVKLVGVEPGGIGTGNYHAAPLSADSPKAVVHGFFSHVMLDEKEEVVESYSIASGLNYPSVGPEHSYLKDQGLAEYVAINDFEALDAFRLLSRREGIIPAIESAHALAYALKIAKDLKKKDIIVVNLSGRGDKDMDTILTSEKKALELKAKLNL